MSSIAMAADSTQVEARTDRTDRPQKRKKKSAEKKKGSKKNMSFKKLKKALSDDVSGSDNDSDLDLTKELYPIGRYIHKLEEMVSHLFRSITTPKLKAMLPEILKNLSVEELKRLCLEELEVMSKKRIHRILDGADPDTISSSGTEDDSAAEYLEEPEGNDQKEVSGNQTEETWDQEQEEMTWDEATQSQAVDSTSQVTGNESGRTGDFENESDFYQPATPPGDPDEDHSVSSTPALSLEPDQEDVESMFGGDTSDGTVEGSDGEPEEGEIRDPRKYSKPSAAGHSDKQTNEPNNEQVIDTPVHNKHNLQEEINTVEVSQAHSGKPGPGKPQEDTGGQKVTQEAPTLPSDSIPILSKTQMEILELEMRARAIKAMLKAHTKKQ